MTSKRGRLVDLRGLKIEHTKGSDLVRILCTDFKVNQGDCIALVGPSGSGKTSLLEVLGLLVRPKSVDHFTIWPDASETPVDLAALADTAQERAYLDETADFRAAFVATMPQKGALLQNFTAFENAALHPTLAGMTSAEARRRISEWARLLGVETHLDKRPFEISGGEAQRIALVRALAPGPDLILADEPTASLDPTLRSIAYGLMRNAAEQASAAVVITTHDPEAAAAEGFEIIKANSSKGDDGAPEHRFHRSTPVADAPHPSFEAAM